MKSSDWLKAQHVIFVFRAGLWAFVKCGRGETDSQLKSVLRGVQFKSAS